MGVRCFGSSLFYGGVSGVAHVSVPDSAGLRMTSWTLECCVRIDADIDVGATYGIITKGGLDGTTKAGYWLGYVNVAGVRSLKCGFYTAAGSAKTLTAAQTLDVGRWYSVMAQYKSSTGLMELYVEEREHPGLAAVASDYTIIGSVTHGANTPNASTATLRFGADCSTADEAQNGAYATISDVRLFSGVIAEATMESRLTKRMTGQEDLITMAGYWRLDDGLANAGTTTAYERSLKGYTSYNGTLQNGAQWSDDPVDLYYESAYHRGAYLGWLSLTRRAGTTLALTSEDSAYPATNLACPRQQIVARTTTAAAIKYLVWTCADPVGVDCLTILGHNFTAGTTLRIEAHTSDSWGSPSVAETITFEKGQITHFFQRRYQFKFWRLSMTDTSLSYLQVGCADLWHGMPIPHTAYEPRESLTDVSTAMVASHGARTPRVVATNDVVSLAFPHLRRGHAEELFEIVREVGGAAPVLAIPDVRRKRYLATYGYVVGLPSIKHLNAGLVDESFGELSILRDKAA